MRTSKKDAQLFRASFLEVSSRHRSKFHGVPNSMNYPTKVLLRNANHDRQMHYDNTITADENVNEFFLTATPLPVTNPIIELVPS